MNRAPGQVYGAPPFAVIRSSNARIARIGSGLAGGDATAGDFDVAAIVPGLKADEVRGRGGQHALPGLADESREQLR